MPTTSPSMAMIAMMVCRGTLDLRCCKILHPVCEACFVRPNMLRQSLREVLETGQNRYVYTYTYIYIYVCMYVHMHMFIGHVCIYIYTYCLYVCLISLCLFIFRYKHVVHRFYIYIFICMYVCVCGVYLLHITVCA